MGSGGTVRFMYPAGARRALAGAQELIRDHGWIQGRLKTDSGFCIDGAIREAANLRCPGYEMPASFTALRFVRAVLRLPKEGCLAPFDWNDQPGRTQAEVLEVLEQAEILAERREIAERQDVQAERDAADNDEADEERL